MGPLGGVLAGTVRGAERAPGSLRAWWARSVWHVCVFVVGWDTWAGVGIVAFARGLRRRVCVCMHAVGGVVLARMRVVGVCGGDTARVLVLCACLRSVRALVWRRRACEACR